MLGIGQHAPCGVIPFAPVGGATLGRDVLFNRMDKDDQTSFEVNQKVSAQNDYGISALKHEESR